MKHARTAIFLAGLCIFSGFAASAEPPAAPYDPVARAVALGLTAEIVDAAFDRALAAAEGCDAVAAALQTMACDQRNIAKSDTPALPQLLG